MNKKFLAFFVVVVILFLGFFMYSKLGGFSKSEMVVADSPAYTIIGKPYEGRMKDKAFGKSFDDAEKLIKEQKIQGMVCGVYYNQPQKEKDTLKAFVGVIVENAPDPLPAGFSKRVIEARKVVKATIKAHYLFAPNIYPEIDSYAEKNHIQLKQLPAIEIYPQPDVVVVEVPLK